MESVLSFLAFVIGLGPAGSGKAETTNSTLITQAVVRLHCPTSYEAYRETDLPKPAVYLDLIADQKSATPLISFSSESNRLAPAAVVVEGNAIYVQARDRSSRLNAALTGPRLPVGIVARDLEALIALAPRCYWSTDADALELPVTLVQPLVLDLVDRRRECVARPFYRLPEALVGQFTWGDRPASEVTTVFVPRQTDVVRLRMVNPVLGPLLSPLNLTLSSPLGVDSSEPGSYGPRLKVFSEKENCLKIL